MKTIFLTIGVALGAIATFAQNSYTVTVQIKDFKQDEGMAFISLQNPEKQAIQRTAVNVKNKQAQIVFKNVPAGSYAVRLFHDENGNKQLDTGMFGIPKEAWGCSNNVKASFGPPDFEKMLFEVKTDKTIAISMN